MKETAELRVLELRSKMLAGFDGDGPHFLLDATPAPSYRGLCFH